jgi:hypothetical protein
VPEKFVAFWADTVIAKTNSDIIAANTKFLFIKIAPKLN